MGSEAFPLVHSILSRRDGEKKERTRSRNLKLTSLLSPSPLHQYPDVAHGTVDGTPIPAAIGDDAWLGGEFISTVQQRGAAIISARGASSALSAASSACDHIRDWVCGTKEGEWVSMGVWSDGTAYGAPKDVIFSFPVTCKEGEWKVVEGLELSAEAKEKLAATGAELVEEAALAKSCLGE